MEALDFTPKETSKKIVKILQCRFPDVSDHHFEFVHSMVDYFDKINAQPGNMFVQILYPEFLEVEKLRSIRDKMKSEIIEQNVRFAWKKDNPKNDYEEGVYCAIHFIDFIIHCILSD